MNHPVPIIMFTPSQEDDSLADYAGDRTQPTAEIMNALSMNSPVKPEPQDPQVPPPSEYDMLTVQLLQSPHQPELWRRLVNVAEATGDISKISAAYDALLKQYPNTVCGGLIPFPFSFFFGLLLTCAQASAQIQYINHFLNTETTFDKAQDLFKKFLRTSPCVELWTFYLTYVRYV